MDRNVRIPPPPPPPFAVFSMRMSTKRRPGDVRTRVEVFSEGGSGSHRMYSRIDMEPIVCHA